MTFTVNNNIKYKASASVTYKYKQLSDDSAFTYASILLLFAWKVHHCVKERAYERARDLETSCTFIPLVMGYRFETLYPPAEIKSKIHIVFHFIQFFKRCLCKYICSSIHVYQHLHLSLMLLHSSYYIYISIHGFHYSVVASLFVS